MPNIEDVHGLNEFFIDELCAEVVDGTGMVRIYCGTRRHNEVNWLYSCVIPAETLLRAQIETKRIATEAWNTAQMNMRVIAH